MHRWALIVSVFALVGSPVASFGQHEPGLVEPAGPEGQQPGDESKVDAAGVMRAADAAVTKLKSLGFKANSRGVGGMATRSPVVEATVRMVKTDESPGWKFLARGTAMKIAGDERTPFSTSFDGTTIRSLREKDRQVAESTWDYSTETLGDGAGWAVTWAMRWRDLVTNQFADPETSPKCRYEGEALVEGTKCHVVYVDYSEMSDPTLFDAWWYIAQSDSLPRRVEMHFIDTGNGDGFTSTTLTALEPDAPIETSALALVTPQGFEVKTLEDPNKKRRAGGGAPKPTGPQVGQPAPDWTLKDAAGKEHKLSEYRGKVVVMDFWATWCGPCRAAMPGVQKIHEKYGGKGAVVFGVNCWESGDPVKLMKDEKFTYGLLLSGDDTAVKYGVSGIPAIYVIGPDGKVLYGSVGFEGEEVVERAVKEGLK
jgi:thiol-disulfide isomerase/thioredoxin